MKRLLFLSVLLIFTLSANAQALLNFTESEIRNKFPDQVFMNGTGFDGNKMISTKFDFAYVGYYFNNEGYTFFVNIIPINNGALNGLVEYYNDNYVIISATEWHYYTDNGIMKIELFFNDAGIPVFNVTNL